jgi:hypothetical protein
MSGLPCSISEHGHHAGAFTTSSGPEKYNTKCASASAIYGVNIGAQFGSAFNSDNKY